MTNVFFVMHDGIPREMFAEFIPQMDSLFGGAVFNPYRTEAVGNTIPVASNTGFAGALDSLPDGSIGQSFYRLIGIGQNVHSTADPFCG